MEWNWNEISWKVCFIWFGFDCFCLVLILWLRFFLILVFVGLVFKLEVVVWGFVMKKLLLLLFVFWVVMRFLIEINIFVRYLFVLRNYFVFLLLDFLYLCLCLVFKCLCFGFLDEFFILMFVLFLVFWIGDFFVFWNGVFLFVFIIGECVLVFFFGV